MCVATRGSSKDNRNDNDKDGDDDDGAEKQLDDAAAAAGEGVCVCVANRMENIFLISCHQYQMKCYSAQAETSLLSPPPSFLYLQSTAHYSAHSPLPL